MRIKQSQINPLAKQIVLFLKTKQLASFQQSDEVLIHLVVEVFGENFEAEERLNEEAKKLLDQNKKKIGLNIDEDRAFAMIKKQLAKERNFVL